MCVCYVIFFDWVWVELVVGCWVLKVVVSMVISLCMVSVGCLGVGLLRFRIGFKLCMYGVSVRCGKISSSSDINVLVLEFVCRLFCVCVLCISGCSMFR